MSTSRRLHLIPILSFAVLLVLGCENSERDVQAPAPEPVSSEPPLDPSMQLASVEAWKRGEQALQQTLEASRELHRQLEALLLAPRSATLTAARQQWRQAHGHWHRLDPLLALTKSNPGLFGGLERLVANIDAQPIQPGYLDYLEQYPYTGIVNDITLAINAQTLRAQHGLTDASDVSLGFHALEFLLWGENGHRPATDFQVAEQPSSEQREAGLTIAELPNNRRRDLLVLISHLLQDDIKELMGRWRGPDSRLYQTYHRLHPASRVELLKNAAEQYLRQDAPELLTTSGTDEAHNGFADDSLNTLLQGLIGLQNLFQEGENDLLRSSETEPRQAWLTQLNQLITQLTEREAQQSLGPEIRQELRQQLEQLASFLRPTELDTTLLSRE